MANLGYWQLKAAPGVWTLALALGRSTEIYTLSGKDEGTNKGPVSKRIIISDFRGVPVRIDVVKKGMENERILDIEGDEDSFKTKVFSVISHSLCICEHFVIIHLRLYFNEDRKIHLKP
jgi:UDP-glucose:glycoprotein glucosyltransferase